MKNKQTMCQWLKWDFEANGNLIIKCNSGNLIYSEDSNGYWKKYEYCSQGNCCYWEDSNRYWIKYEYDSENNLIYWEDSNGVIKDKRPKPIPKLTLELLSEQIESLAKEVLELSEIMMKFLKKP